MPTPVVPVPLRRVGIAVVLVTAVAVLLLSHTFGRAVPTNSYRPLLTADPIELGCYPLPGGARLDLPYQVRWDGNVETSAGERRLLRAQYDLVDRDEAERRVVEAFTEVGFREVPTDVEDQRVLRGPGGDEVRIAVTELPDTSEETLVRGEVVADLPVAELARDHPDCHHLPITKRWAEAE